MQGEATWRQRQRLERCIYVPSATDRASGRRGERPGMVPSERTSLMHTWTLDSPPLDLQGDTFL